VPVFDDWSCVGKLLSLIDAALSGAAAGAQVILIDDGSTIPVPEDLVTAPLASISEVSVLRLRGNLGHQRAIAIGLYYVHQFLAADATIVMDADGEDQPGDIPALLSCLDRNGRRALVFAARTKRLERRSFRFFYHLYRAVHRVLTGIAVRVGNFSVVPRACLERLMISSDLWNHYAAAAFRSKAPIHTVPLERGRRLNGRSRMNFFGLVIHGLSAISVFADVVSVRLLVGATFLGLISLLLAAGVLFGRHAMPTWAVIGVGSLAIVFLQAMMLSLVLVLAVISTRSHTSFIPLRDSEYYILEHKPLWGKDERAGLSRRRISAL
jgi:glycosyltransferase involved in cell wall biosynthesis